MEIDAGSSKKIGKNFLVFLSRPIGDFTVLKVTVRNIKTGKSKSTKFIPHHRGIKHYKKLDSVKKIKEIYKF